MLSNQGFDYTLVLSCLFFIRTLNLMTTGIYSLFLLYAKRFFKLNASSRSS